MRLVTRVIISSLSVGGLSCTPSTPVATPARPSPAPVAAAAAAPDSAAAESARMVEQVLTSIAGHETEPAGQVFKNLKALGGLPARGLLNVMNLGYGRSLGVSCSHCHVVEDWASDAKPQKQIARDMAQMVTTINTQLLRNIQNLKGPNPIVNCTTCHRGMVKPALNLPP